MAKKKTNTDASLDAFLDAILEGLGPEAAAAKACLTPEMVSERFDPVKIAHAEGLALGKIEGMLFDQALNGKITAMIFWLANRSPERWKHLSSIGKGDVGGGLTALEQTIKDLDES